MVERGLLANEWVKEVAGVMGSRGGGSKASAQTAGTFSERFSDALQVATEFARLKLQ